MAKPTCSIDGCDDPVSGWGWCSKHYQRWKHNGDPLITKRRFRQADICETPGCDKPGYMRGLCLSRYRVWQMAQRSACSVEGCETPWKASRLCAVHYTRWRRTGSTEDPKRPGRPCSVDGCEDRVAAREYCQKHYRNWRRYGTPIAPPRPPKVYPPCSESGCDAPAIRKNGMCNLHYRHDRATAKPRRCKMPGCLTLAYCDGFCQAHCGRPRHLLEKYGITAAKYDAMVIAQRGLCAICRQPPSPTERVKRLVVDHDHSCCPGGTSCGKCVRGLLCNWCNRFLGFARDDPKRLRGAIAYLKRTAAPKPEPLAEVVSLF